MIPVRTDRIETYALWSMQQVHLTAGVATGDELQKVTVNTTVIYGTVSSADEPSAIMAIHPILQCRPRHQAEPDIHLSVVLPGWAYNLPIRDKYDRMDNNQRCNQQQL